MKSKSEYCIALEYYLRMIVWCLDSEVSQLCRRCSVMEDHIPSFFIQIWICDVPFFEGNQHLSGASLSWVTRPGGLAEWGRTAGVQEQRGHRNFAKCSQFTISREAPYYYHLFFVKSAYYVCTTTFTLKNLFSYQDA